MRLVTYKCDRCHQKIDHKQVMRLTVYDPEYGNILEMDICPECSDKLAGFLGLDLEFSSERGEQDE